MSEAETLTPTSGQGGEARTPIFVLYMSVHDQLISPHFHNVPNVVLGWIGALSALTHPRARFAGLLTP